MKHLDKEGELRFSAWLFELKQEFEKKLAEQEKLREENPLLALLEEGPK